MRLTNEQANVHQVQQRSAGGRARRAKFVGQFGLGRQFANGVIAAADPLGQNLNASGVLRGRGTRSCPIEGELYVGRLGEGKDGGRETTSTTTPGQSASAGPDGFWVTKDPRRRWRSTTAWGRSSPANGL